MEGAGVEIVNLLLEGIRSDWNLFGLSVDVMS